MVSRETKYSTHYNQLAPEKGYTAKGIPFVPKVKKDIKVLRYSIPVTPIGYWTN